jgi:hypothetical protein
MEELYRSCGTHEREEKLLWCLVFKPEGRSFGKLRFRWENGIKMDFM